MASLRKAFVLALLVVLLYAQTAPVNTSLYTLNTQTYQHIYGIGTSSSSTVSRASDSSGAAFKTDGNYVVPPTSPPPVQIRCPINQIYDNILCQCVCIVGFYF